MHRQTSMFLGSLSMALLLLASSTAHGQLKWGSGHSHGGGSGGSGWGNASSWIGLGAKLLENSNNHNHHHHDHYDNNNYYPQNQRYYYPQNNNQQQYYYPQQQYTQPTYTQPTYTQPAAVAPVAPAPPATNAIPVVVVKPVSNQGFLLTAKRLTPDQIKRNEIAIQNRIDREFLELDREFKLSETAAKEAIIARLGLADPVAATALVEALKRGDADTIRIRATGQDAVFIDLVTRVADARQAMIDMRELARGGNFTDADRRGLIDAMSAANPNADAAESFARVAGLVAAVLIDSQILDLLRTAVAGNPNEMLPLSGGGNGQIVIVPQLPPGQVLDLGNGAAFIGGGPTATLAVSTGSVAEAMGFDVAPGVPVPDTKAPAVNSGVILKNAPDSPEKVHYTIDGRPYACDPGYIQPLTESKSWVVAFDRGGSFGKASYTLSDGTYTYTLTAKGWELFKQTITIKLDNTDNVVDFHYVWRGKQEVCPAHSVKEITAGYEIDVEFDNGMGESRKKKLDSGTYKIALAQDERSVDLFEPGSGVFTSNGSEGGNADPGLLFGP